MSLTTVVVKLILMHHYQTVRWTKPCGYIFSRCLDGRAVLRQQPIGEHRPLSHSLPISYSGWCFLLGSHTLLRAQMSLIWDHSEGARFFIAVLDVDSFAAVARHVGDIGDRLSNGLPTIPKRTPYRRKKLGLGASAAARPEKASSRLSSADLNLDRASHRLLCLDGLFLPGVNGLSIFTPHCDRPGDELPRFGAVHAHHVNRRVPKARLANYACGDALGPVPALEYGTRSRPDP